MHNSLTPLLQRGRDLTRAEYRALAFVADNTYRINKLTVRMLAEETFVSTATIMRLCQKLGFSGFSEFIFHIKLLLNDYPTQPPLPPSETHQPTPLAFPQFVANYQRTFDFISAESISAFSQLLHQQESFFLYGTGFSHLFAEYLAKKLQILGKTAFASGLGDSRSIFLNNAAKYRVFIAISRSGETEQVLDKARIALSSGMTVVVFTRASFNSLSRLADIHFQLYDDASNEAVDVGEITSFESNLVMLIDLLLLHATG
ncbi:MurR/RpiR family transcriptional regulator [Winslowiella iniecta]|uniref:RpiR family transcriptional regulator n=1 Tax=Winslowiella iniecta TaxID=1560201 RepID=A0A0L7T7T5_9GAMM|nr:MurR/RpiR family transcriptional regulator [Winslowiella iniecta]KOC91437.1 RpiR family transcriptional regulator [Winslowiella iniecta]KOC92102.1 RpiR family transcriptional regulator [Winslowiella iniecta]